MIDDSDMPQDGLPERLSVVVRRIRLNSGLTQAQVSERARMRSQQWSKIENYPRKDISLRTFCRVAEALSLSGTQLLAILETTPSECISSGN